MVSILKLRYDRYWLADNQILKKYIDWSFLSDKTDGLSLGNREKNIREQFYDYFN